MHKVAVSTLKALESFNYPRLRLRPALRASLRNHDLIIPDDYFWPRRAFTDARHPAPLETLPRRVGFDNNGRKPRISY